eukprot:s418_g26.t1
MDIPSLPAMPYRLSVGQHMTTDSEGEEAAAAKRRSLYLESLRKFVETNWDRSVPEGYEPWLRQKLSDCPGVTEPSILQLAWGCDPPVGYRGVVVEMVMRKDKLWEKDSGSGGCRSGEHQGFPSKVPLRIFGHDIAHADKKTSITAQSPVATLTVTYFGLGQSYCREYGWPALPNGEGCKKLFARSGSSRCGQ